MRLLWSAGDPAVHIEVEVYESKFELTRSRAMPPNGRWIEFPEFPAPGGLPALLATLAEFLASNDETWPSRD